VSEDIIAALDHKVPTVPVETLTWMTTCLSTMDKVAVGKLDKSLLFAVLKNTEASAPAVRDAAMAALAAAFTRGGDLGYIRSAVENMEPTRKKRLQALIAEASSGGIAPDARPATASAAPPQAAAAALKAAVPARPTTAGALSRSTSGVGGSRAPKASPGASRTSAADDENFEASDVGCNPEDVAAAVDSLVGEGYSARMGAAEWKERLEATTALMTALISTPPDVLSTHCDAIVRQLGIAPGWEERNLQVTAKCFEVLEFLARQAPDFSKHTAMLAMGAVVSKVAEPKLKAPSADVLTAWAESLGPRFVAAQLYKRASAHKNPKVLELALGWWSFAMEEFGGRLFDMRFTINAAKDCVAHTNPSVKAAAVRLLGCVHAAYGPAVKAFFTDFKPALMPVLETEFLRCPHNTAALEGTRHVKNSVPGAGAASGGTKPAGGGGAAAAALAVSDGLPRDDISALITPKLIKDLSAADWKARVSAPAPAFVRECSHGCRVVHCAVLQVRQASLDAIETIINEAGRRVGPNVGLDTMPALKGRLTDANKMLVIAALRVIALLADALGVGAADKVCRPVFPDMLKPWGDQKKQARDARTCMWIQCIAALVHADVHAACFSTGPGGCEQGAGHVCHGRASGAHAAGGHGVLRRRQVPGGRSPRRQGVAGRVSAPRHRQLRFRLRVFGGGHGPCGQVVRGARSRRAAGHQPGDGGGRRCHCTGAAGAAQASADGTHRTSWRDGGSSACRC
jgi:cytoskeleton-associated protein 5